MVQVPAARNDAKVPATVHVAGVVEAKLTGSPALLVATRERGVPIVCAGILANVMVCG